MVSWSEMRSKHGQLRDFVVEDEEASQIDASK